jgi:hypothetical protein
MRKLTKYLKKILLLTLPSILLFWILLEIVFRTVIPADNPPRSYFDEDEKMLRYINTPETGQRTIGRFAQIRTRWHINNQGWNYPVDYVPRHEKKLIAVIGDSYVEALQVDVDQNYPYLLREKLQSEYDVYAFGVSGAPLSHYLHISRFVRNHFDPDILIFNIVHNDFDESLQSWYPEFYYYMQLTLDASGAIHETVPKPIIRRAQYRPWWQKLLLKSALFRYLHFNLKATHSIRRLFQSKHRETGTIRREFTPAERKDVTRITRYVVETIRRENPDKRIIFVMDAPRPEIYDDPMPQSEKSWLNDMMKTICAESDVEFIDVTTFLREEYRRYGKRFDFSIDGHWNAYGHQRIADVLEKHIRGKK